MTPQTFDSPSPTPPKGARNFGRWAILLVVLAGTGWWFLGRPQTQAPSGPSSVAISTATATKRQLPVTLHAVGNVVAYESVAIRARLDSQITAVHFKDGDEVKKGDLLFELDDKSLRAQAAQLEANIARDRAQLENARRQSGRAQVLAEKGFATTATKDDSAANVAVAQASLNASLAALDAVRVQLGYTRITAPISGRTGTINFTLGNNVRANDAQALVTINQLKPIRVQAALPQNYFEALRAAMQAGPVTVTATQQGDENGDHGTIATGTLDYIDNAVDAATGTFATRAGFTNEDERLVPGMFVTVKLTLGTEEGALVVPEVAIQHGQSGDFVFVIMGEKALRRDVKVARLQDNLAVIESGLEEGTTVATDGLMGLKDGSTVTIAKEPATATTAAPTPPP